MWAQGRLSTFALAAAGAILAAGCTGGAALGDKAGGGGGPVVLRMASTGTNSGYSPAIEYFLQRVKELSAGDLSIDVVYGWGNFSPDAERQSILDVAAGTADLTAAGPRVFDTMGVNSFRALTAPMLIDSYPVEDAVVASGIPGEMLAGLEKVGVTGLGVLGGSLNKPIAVEGPLLGPADWQGVTFETYLSQTQAQAIQALGAQSTNVLGAGLDAGLQSGQIQGFSKGLLVYSINGTERLAPYVTANVNLWPGMQVLLANPGRLSRLSEQQRGLLRQAAQDAVGRSTSLVEHEDQIVADVCQAGARLSNASQTDLTALRQAFVPVYSSLEEDPQTKSFIARIEALKQSTAAGAPLAIPVGCTGSPSEGQTSSDPITGTWQTGKITETDWVRAFIALGGSEKDAHGSFAELFGARRYVVLTVIFGDGDYELRDSSDGGPVVHQDGGTYEIAGDGTLTLVAGGCSSRLRYAVSGDTLYGSTS
jgi:TRAP-type C4-dicarboxylate transport system substrate-binding protein